MNPSDIGAGSKKLNAISIAFEGLRETVIADWVVRVVDSIPAAGKLGRPILTNTLPVLYDDIAQALTPDYPRAIANQNNNLGAAHGRERASLTEYTLSDLVQELQVFRDVIFDVAEASGINFQPFETKIIQQSIDAEIRQSITSFNASHDEDAQMLIARLSHDLRNPLHIANTAIELVRLRSKEGEAITLANLAVTKLKEVDAMVQTILDTAIISRHQKVELKMEPFDMKVLAEEACSALELVGRRCDVKGESVLGYWNRPALKRVLENLLSNAEKFGATNTEIVVSISAAEGRVLLAVHNEGDPIPSEELPRLFTAFERGLEQVDVTGWGLGLAYVQQIAESHKGTVLVDSAVGRGTTFTVSIPVDCRQSALTR